MKYAVEAGSVAMTNIPRFKNIFSGIQMFILIDGHTDS
jgi:hypothetical protein